MFCNGLRLSTSNKENDDDDDDYHHHYADLQGVYTNNVGASQL